MTLQERITEAQRRIMSGLAPMRIPADPCDPDVVLADCSARLAALEHLAERVLHFESEGLQVDSWADPLNPFADSTAPTRWGELVELAEKARGGG